MALKLSIIKTGMKSNRNMNRITNIQSDRLLQYTTQIYKQIRMCGNEISSVEQPVVDSAFYEKVRKQLPTRVVQIKDHAISAGDVLVFSRLDTFHLKQLSLINCSISHELLQHLMSCDFSGLERLNLSNNKIGPIGCRYIAACDTLKNLQSLEINQNKIKDNGLRALTLGVYSNLEDISLNDNEVTSDSIPSLSAFINLQYISMSGNDLSDGDIPKILKANPDGFVFLGLSRNKLTQAVLFELLKMKSLEVLLLDRNDIKTNKEQLKVRDDLFLFY